jgi:hypothetical protein
MFLLLRLLTKRIKRIKKVIRTKILFKFRWKLKTKFKFKRRRVFFRLRRFRKFFKIKQRGYLEKIIWSKFNILLKKNFLYMKDSFLINYYKYIRNITRKKKKKKKKYFINILMPMQKKNLLKKNYLLQ